MTISYRVRKQIVDYFAQRKSSQEIASMLNVSLDQIQDWRRRYKHGHEDWVFSDYQKFSIQERKEILVDFFSQQKYGIKAYAARHNLSYNTFKGWVKKVRKYGGSIDFAFISHRPKIKNWDEGTKNGPDRSALLGHNFVYQETKPHGFYSSYFHQRISS